MTDRPLLNMGSVRNLVCQKHEAALAADPTVNSVAFPLEVLQEALADTRTTDHCKDIAAVGPFLISHAPVCEWLPPEATARAWEKARSLGRGGRA